MGDLEKSVQAVSDAEIAALVEEYDATYEVLHRR
jgi:L-arabinose isomerase